MDLTLIEEGKNTETISILAKNIKIQGNAGIVIGVFSSNIIGILLAALSKQISSWLINGNSSDRDEILHLAETMLITNGIGLFVDTLRNMSGGEP